MGLVVIFLLLLPLQCDSVHIGERAISHPKISVRRAQMAGGGMPVGIGADALRRTMKADLHGAGAALCEGAARC
jgi:hypothetical protein